MTGKFSLAEICLDKRVMESEGQELLPLSPSFCQQIRGVPLMKRGEAGSGGSLPLPH